MRGDLIIAIDNCEAPLEGVVFNQALTQTRANLRILGQSKAIRVRCAALITATGNNLIVKGREERMRAADQSLDRLIAKLSETGERLRLNGAPASWGGKAQFVYNSRRLTECMRRRMITLRLTQLASQQANDGGLKFTRSFKPRAEALAAIPELGQVWRTRSNRTPGAGARQCSIRLAQGLGER